MPKSVSTVTAGNLRDYFNADAKRLALLSPEARKTVEAVDGKNPRGRVHAEAVKVHNSRRPTRQYVTGSTKVATAESKAAAAALREQAAKAGHTVGKRGPLPKEFLATVK
jgi:hypothetical protein